MNLQQLINKLECYQNLIAKRDVLLAVVAQGSRDWEITSTVSINGNHVPFSLPIPNAVANTVITDKIADMNATITTLQTELGIS